MVRGRVLGRSRILLRSVGRKFELLAGDLMGHENRGGGGWIDGSFTCLLGM